MKQIFKIIVSMPLIICMMMASVWAQPFIESEGISVYDIDVRGQAVTVAQISITTEHTGKAIVKFNGQCYASVGDRIVLAASDSPNWSANDGNVNIEVINTDLNYADFSHTRVYAIGAGSHDFYAVVQNYVEMDGTGLASIYGNLSVEFIPTVTGQEFVEFTGIAQPNVNLRGAPVVLNQLEVTIPADGKVLVTFDGNCIATPGDRIVLAASDAPQWSPNDGNVSIEVFDDDVNRQSFSHTREYNVTQGIHTFYAVGQNYVEMDGSGIGSVYGSLTVQYVPNTASSKMVMQHSGISAVNTNFRGAPVTLSEISINVPLAGTVEVSFDGSCYTSPGDRIVLAASYEPYWFPNDGNVSVEAYDDDLNHFPFSHTRVYNVMAGAHTFYAVGENYVETAGTGIGSVYGSLTVLYTPFFYIGLDEKDKSAHYSSVYPNPVKNEFTYYYSGPTVYSAPVELVNIMGKTITTLGYISEDNRTFVADVSYLSRGMYFIRLNTGRTVEVVRMIKVE